MRVSSLDPLINISKSEFLAFGSEDGLCNHGCIRMGRSSTTTLGSVPSVDPIRRRRCLLLLLIILLRHMGRRTDDALTPNWRLEWRRQQVVLLRFPAWRQKVLVHDLARGLNTLHQIIWMHHFFVVERETVQTVRFMRWFFYMQQTVCFDTETLESHGNKLLR